MSFRRFRRSQLPRHQGMPFTDVGDSHTDSVSNLGRGSVLPANPQVAPRSLVRRLLDLDSFGNPERIFWSGYGADQPHVSPRSAVRRSVVAPVFRAARPVTPLQAKQRQLSWLAFNRLQVQAPRRVAFCVRRQQRKEVLHALGIAGRRGLVGRGGSYHRTSNSSWRC